MPLKRNKTKIWPQNRRGWFLFVKTLVTGSANISNVPRKPPAPLQCSQQTGDQHRST